MANKEKGEVGFTLGKQSFRFKLGTDQLIELQEFFADPEVVARMHAETEAARLKTALLNYGKHKEDCKGKPCTCGFQAAVMTPNGHRSVPTIESIVAEVLSGRLKYVRAFLWAGLLKFHPEMTQNKVSNLIDGADESQVMRLLQSLGMTTQADPVDVKELSEGVKPANPRKARATRGTGGNSTSKPKASA